MSLPHDPDQELMYEFLSAYVNAAGTRGRIELAFGRDKPSTAKHFGVDQTELLVSLALARNAGEQNVYIGAALRKEDAPGNKRAAKADILAAPAVWADFDDEGALERALEEMGALGLCPHFTTVTGRHPHTGGQCWFWLEEPAFDLDLVEHVNAVLADRFGGDPSVKNRDRLMRLPGSIAWPRKPGRIPELTHRRPS